MVKVDVLRQVSNLYSRSHPDPSAVRDLLTQDHFQQRGLTASVVPDQGDALASGHLQPQAGEEGAPAEALGEPLDGQHLVPAELPLAESDLHLPLLFGAVGDPHPLDALLHGFDPLEGLVHSGIGPHPHLLGGLLQLLDLGLLLLVLLQLLLVAAFLLHGVEAVTALVKFRPALLDLDDAVHHLIQKIAVMGDGENRPLEFTQVLLQPLGGPQVQMVRRLVQQQDVGVLQDQAGQVHPGLFPAGQAVKQLLPHSLGDGQAVAYLVDPGVYLIAPRRLIGRRELVVPGHQGRVRAGGHLPGEPGQLFLHLSQGLKGGGQHILHGIARRIDRDLGDQPHPLSRGDHYLALVIVHHAGEDTQQRGLAAAVGPQQAHPLPSVHLEGEPI